MNKIRKIDLSNLPTKEHAGKIAYDWKSVCGIKVLFKYDECEGFLEIVGCSSKKGFIDVKYKNTQKSINTNNLTRCRIGSIIGKFEKDFRYNNGDVLYIKKTNSNIKIVSRFRENTGTNDENRKMYEYECLEDGNLSTISERDIMNGYGCCICIQNKKVYTPNKKVYTENTIYKTHNHLMKFFVDENDAKTNSFGSNKRVMLKCDICGEMKEMRIDHFVSYGFSCPACSDEVSYANKFVYNVIKSVYDGTIILEKTFCWSNRKVYDIYIPEFNMIIENHGEQHYKETHYFQRSLIKEQENDELKYKMAIDNNISKYISIDCRFSDREYIKKKILQTELLDIIGNKDIDWKSCDKKSQNNRFLEVCELWNRDLSVKEISNETSFSEWTVREYLRKGHSIGLCSYNPRRKSDKLKESA